MLSGLGFEARNIFCIGRNYAEHAKELKNEIPSQPVVFLKPTGALTQGGDPLRLPPITQNVHHEVEVVVAIARPLSGEITAADAISAIAGLAVGIDVTARDLQDVAKSKGLPWSLAKGLQGFAPVSDFVAADPSRPFELDRILLELVINGETRQRGSTADLLFPIPTLIAYLARHFSLQRGDLIFTGTPSGVGPIKAGDSVLARLDLGFAQRVLELSVVDGS